MTLPLLVSLESTLVAMMLFEPLRGLLRRAQYLLVDYAGEDPIHLLTPLVTLMALAMLLRSQRLNMFRATPLAGSVSVLALIFVLEIFNPLQGGLLIGLSGAMFLLVPMVWFYFGQSVSEKFMHTALRLVVLAGIVASLYGVYQMMFGYPAFEQYWIDNTDFYTSIAVAHVRRAVATFSSAEEWGRYTEIGAIVAFGLAAGAKQIPSAHRLADLRRGVSERRIAQRSAHCGFRINGGHRDAGTAGRDHLAPRDHAPRITAASSGAHRRFRFGANR